MASRFALLLSCVSLFAAMCLANSESPALTAHVSRRHLYLAIGYFSDSLLKPGITMETKSDFMFYNCPPLLSSVGDHVKKTNIYISGHVLEMMSTEK